MSWPQSDGGSPGSTRKPGPLRLPNSAAKSTRDFHKQAAGTERDKIVEVAEQDPSTVLLHSLEIGNPYYIGDIYDPQPLEIAKQWEIDTSNSPYLRHIKSLSQGWPHLRWLSDFMEVSTTPLRWKHLQHQPEYRAERAGRTHVTRLDFRQDSQIESKEFFTAEDLNEGLARRKNKADESNPVRLQLFLVEDLSRSVIESLGSTFDIDPSFFREHVNDYAWYNVRDRFADPPQLDIITRQQNWFQIRWVRPRYFRTRSYFENARIQANHFNVLRRPDEDYNNKALFDNQDATVAITRTRASYWMSTQSGDDIPTGILLLDPTISEGTPLWRGYRNWEWPPKMSDTTAPKNGPPNTSLFDDVVYWTKRTYTSSPLSLDSTTDPMIPIQAFLHLVCADWLTMISYLSTRLGQLEWEISFPEDFKLEDAADSSLKKLHVWRRLIPLYIEMLRDVDKVFNFPPAKLDNNNLATSTTTLSPTSIGNASSQRPPPPFHALQPSFAAALTRMKDLQERLVRLTSIATDAINIAEARLSFTENKNVARLSWLATVFIPLSFVSGLFSIQPNIPDLTGSFKYFFATALPLAVLTIVVAFVSRWKGWHELKRRITKEGKNRVHDQPFVFYGKDKKKTG